MYNDILSKLGLAKNEAKIYETLLRYGESSVGNISTKANINRRNVYDSLNRLIEKGLIFEIRLPHENAYQAVDPKKLMEIIKEKEEALAKVMPDLEKIYGQTPHEDEVYIYRGLEGWKNYMRDIIRVGEDDYTIGGRAQWSDDRVRAFSQQIIDEAKKKNIKFHILYDHDVKGHDTVEITNGETRFLPATHSTKAAIDIFGDYVVILSTPQVGIIDENSSFTVIVNRNIADSFRAWFQILWKVSGSNKTQSDY